MLGCFIYKLYLDDGYLHTFKKTACACPYQDGFLPEKRSHSLSIVNPLDVLRQRLLLEIARRQMRENTRQVNICSQRWLSHAFLSNVHPSRIIRIWNGVAQSRHHSRKYALAAKDSFLWLCYLFNSNFVDKNRLVACAAGKSFLLLRFNSKSIVIIFHLFRSHLNCGYARHHVIGVTNIFTIKILSDFLCANYYN